MESLTRELDFVPGTGIEGDKPLPGEAGDVESDVPIEGPMPLEKHPGDMSDSCGAETSPSASEPVKESSNQATESLEHDLTPEVHDVITGRDGDRLRYLYDLGTEEERELTRVHGRKTGSNEERGSYRTRSGRAVKIPIQFRDRNFGNILLRGRRE